MDRLTEMEAFVQVVEQGGFSEAARRVGLSKSAISKQIATLEARLGARLLNRTTRRVSPTEIGLAYYEKALLVLKTAAEADAMVTAMQAAPQGLLRVSAPVNLGERLLSASVAAFLTQHPNISVELCLEDRYVDLLSEGYDVAIRIGKLSDSSLMAKKLGLAAMRIVAAPAYLDRAGVPETLDDLARHSLLHYTLMAGGTSWRVRLKTGEERSFRAAGPVTANNGSALLAAAAEGLGIVALPDFICSEALATGRLVPVLPALGLDPLGIYAVYPAGRFMQPKLRAFIDHLAATHEPQP